MVSVVNDSIATIASFNLFVFFNFYLKLVELKNGETYNGHLVSCDSWMNINLRDVICTSKVLSLP